MSDSTFTPLFTGDPRDDDPFVAGAQLVHTDVPVLSESVAAEPGPDSVTVEPRHTVVALTELAPFTVSVPALAANANPARLIGADRHRISLWLLAIGAATDAVYLAPNPPALTAQLPGSAPGTIYGGNVVALYGGRALDISGYTGELYYIGQGAAPVVLTGFSVIKND